MEVSCKIKFINGRMHLSSPNEEGHHVFWCPVNFLDSFIAEWEAQCLETDAGLYIMFFVVKGEKVTILR